MSIRRKRAIPALMKAEFCPGGQAVLGQIYQQLKTFGVQAEVEMFPRPIWQRKMVLNRNDIIYFPYPT